MRDHVSHHEQYVCYVEVEGPQGERYHQRQVEVAASPDEAIVKVLKWFESDYPRPICVEAYLDGTATVANRLTKLARPRYAVVDETG